MTDSITSFTQLRTWQKARKFAVGIYKLTESFPADEKFGLSSQIRRSAVSIGANIAEGFSRSTQKDKVHFYIIGLGSLTETLSHSYIAHDLGYITKRNIEYIQVEFTDLHKMINGLIKSAKGSRT